MTRCLRCKAGNEWIEGNIPDEPAAAELTRLRAIEKAALAVESQYPKDDAPASILRLRDALREKGAEE